MIVASPLIAAATTAPSARMSAHVVVDGVRLVLVERADRLARDAYECEGILRTFAKHEVQVIEAEEGTDLTATDTPTGRLIRGILAQVAQFERDALVAKLRDARRRTGRLGGPPRVSPAARARARRLRGQGLSLGAIAAKLDAECYPTPRGRPWSRSTVRGVLAR